MRTPLRHIRKSLARKISLGLLLMTIPVFMVSMGILFVQSRQQVKQEAVEHAASALDNTAMRVYRHLETIATATNSNAWLISENLEPEALKALTWRIVYFNANVDGCAISLEPGYFPQLGRHCSMYTFRRGDSLISIREKPYDYHAKPWYREPMEKGGACWTNPYRDDADKELVIDDVIVSYGRPIADRKGRTVGVVSSDLSLKKLADVINEDHPYPNAYYMLLDKDGQYLIHPDIDHKGTHNIFDFAKADHQPGITALGHEMTTGGKGYMQVSVHGQRSIVCYQPIEGTDWSMALIIPERDVLHYYNRLAIIITPLIVIGLLLILLLCSRIVALMTMPLRQLLVQSKRIAAGHYDEPLGRSDRQDAIGELQNNFAAMQESLNERLSDIQRMNDETSRRNDELMKASRMAEEAAHQKTAFIQNMTHQIRTPLNIIMGFAQVVRDSMHALPDDELRTITTTMHRNASKLHRMMLMLYDSSETGQFEEVRSMTFDPVPCNEAVREAISTSRAFFPHLLVHFDSRLDDNYCIMSNRLFLVRSLREILCNSAKYADREPVRIKAYEQDGVLRFVIEDTGPGIIEEQREQMFKPFIKYNDLSEGLGLGLPLTKRHVFNLGGDLIFDTSYRQGCRFIMEFPVN